MCGIAGIISTREPVIDRKVLKDMSDAIISRGPDDEGFYFDSHVGLAHRRLSIIDLESGHQPMTTGDGRYTIIFNGEIYNFLEIRKRLIKDGVVFKTNSDTEVLLELFARQGKSCLKELNGMFAFAIWDKTNQQLFAARDRMGKKPFYYALIQNTFIFASEIKALLKHPLIHKRINSQGLHHFFTYEYVPAPYSIIEGVAKLPQAHCLSLDSGQLQIERYWNHSFDMPCDDDEQMATNKLVDLLDQAVQYRLIADVPVGVFLSGGIDSSTIVAMIARHKPGKDIKTFSINFKESSYDESLYSSTVAKKFKTDHYQETLTASTMLDIFPEVTSYMDEPFADGSILPTYLLSRFTRKYVTVALGGDGADELFAGYPTFFANRVAHIYQKFPSLFRKAAHGMAKLLPTSDKNMSLDFKARQFLSGADYEGILKNQMWLAACNLEEQKQLFHPNFYAKVRETDPLDLVRKEMSLCDSKMTGDQLLYFYQKFYLCDDILVKTDRASMAHSLEVRAPFLDPKVVEYVTSLPYSYKLKGVTTKYILKKAVNRMLPAMITQRSKKGFGIPIAGWLKKELKPMMLDSLNKRRIETDGIFNWDFVNRLMQQHLQGKRNNRKQLFALLMLHFWMDRYL